MAIERAMTKVIRPLDDSHRFVQRALELLERKLQSSVKPLTQYRGADVYAFGDKENGYFVLVKELEVLYFVRYEAVRHHLPQALGRQVLVWRNKEASSSASSVGFAQHVFFDYLLPKYKALIADKEQTPNGKQFWEYAIEKAFVLRKHVYFLNRRVHPNTLIQLANSADVLKYENEIWGTENGYLHTFAVISNTPLKIRT